MYELLLRTETLLLGLQTPALLAFGLGALVVGLVLWLGGTRYHAAIVGVLGAVVGAAVGLLVSQQLALSPWLSMVVGAAVLGGLSILLRNILILVLAVLVFAAVGGTGYLAVVLDRVTPPAQAEARSDQWQSVHYFSGMDRAGRQSYLNGISQEAETFAERLKALLADTWQTLSPHGWGIVLALVAGALLGLLLLWLIAKIVIALAYSIVGTAVLFLGAQAVLLAAGVLLASDLAARRWVPAVAFAVMTVLGWAWQLFHAGRRKSRRASPPTSAPSD
jgi:hypothetical protein